MRQFISFFIFLNLLSHQTVCFASNLRETPVVRVVKKCAPLVVNVGTEQIVQLGQHPFWGTYGNQLDPFYNSFFNRNRPSILGTLKLQSLGSGILVSSNGLIATNAHVVSMASKIYVTLHDGQTKEAVLIGTDNLNDIALIKINLDKPAAFMRMAPEVLIGETAISIGNPLGLQNSVSAGIVSAVNRTVETLPQIEAFKDLIQTDASINQGSSGGALVNLEGDLIGMNVAVVENAQGLGFAIPAAKIQKMLDEYEKLKKASSGL